MKILVTGATGQLASSLLERARHWPELHLLTAGRPKLNLDQAGSAKALIASERPDLVVNAAAYTAVDRAEEEPERAFRINADAAGELAAATAAQGAAIIHLSTDYVFDGSLDRPYREDDPVRPINVYGASKAAGEQQVRAANSDHLILRTSWVVSPFGTNFVKTIVTAARTRDQLKVVADQQGRPTSALDLADHILAIAAARAAGARERRGTYHLASSGQTSWFGLADAVMDECRRLGAASATVQPISTEEWPTPAARPRYSVLDCGRFEREFGRVARDWRVATQEIVERLICGFPADPVGHAEARG